MSQNQRPDAYIHAKLLVWSKADSLGWEKFSGGCDGQVHRQGGGARTIDQGLGGSDGKESACNAADLGLIPGLEDPLEKGMAIYSSIFAWRIPWTEEPGGLQSMGSLRVGHD